MKKIAILIGGLMILSLSSCGTTSEKSLYSWYNYEDLSYQYTKKQTPESEAKLLGSYQKMISQQKGARNAVPPGIYAELGYGLIKSGKKSEGIAMLKKEQELYPESKKFIERIIKLLEK